MRWVQRFALCFGVIATKSKGTTTTAHTHTGRRMRTDSRGWCNGVVNRRKGKGRRYKKGLCDSPKVSFSAFIFFISLSRFCLFSLFSLFSVSATLQALTFFSFFRNPEFRFNSSFSLSLHSFFCIHSFIPTHLSSLSLSLSLSLSSLRFSRISSIIDTRTIKWLPPWQPHLHSRFLNQDPTSTTLSHLQRGNTT